SCKSLLSYTKLFRSLNSLPENKPDPDLHSLTDKCTVRPRGVTPPGKPRLGGVLFSERSPALAFLSPMRSPRRLADSAHGMPRMLEESKPRRPRRLTSSPGRARIGLRPEATAAPRRDQAS